MFRLPQGFKGDNLDYIMHSRGVISKIQGDLLLRHRVAVHQTQDT